jgi:hypothetical protein
LTASAATPTNASAGACTHITFEVDPRNLEGYTDEYIVQLWYIGQANPAPFGDVAACDFAECVGREIIRRFVTSQRPPLWSHSGRHVAQAARIAAPAESVDTNTPPEAGQPWPSQGGVYLGLHQGEHLVAMTAPEYNFTGAWGEYGQNVTGAQSRTDGMANTKAMAAAGSAIATKVLTLGFDGREDLFIPSQAQLQHAYATAPDAFEKSGWYWSSTQDSSGSAFVQDFEFGGSLWSIKDYEHRVRAFRAIPLQPLITSTLPA